MITECQRKAYSEKLKQLGITNSADIDAVLDFLYTIASCAIEYEDGKKYEKDTRAI